MNGHYDIQQSEINNRPYFVRGTIALWWSTGIWFFGPVSKLGQFVGYTKYDSQSYCPNGLTKWLEDLQLNCK